MATDIRLATTGTHTWAVPSDWNDANNTIECIGPGADGGSNYGGGGGAYAKLLNLNLTPGSNVSYSIGTHGGDTWFVSTSTVLAKGGSGQNGGSATTSVGSVKVSGHNGTILISGTSGLGATQTTYTNGGDGGDAANSTFGGAGGNGASRSTGYSVSSNPSTPGSNYGGGGGGAAGTLPASSGAQGYIRIVYYPLVSTTTTLTSSINPSVVNQSVTFTATLNTSVPGGTVSFKDGATILATISVSGTQAVFSTSSLAIGTHSITATYNGYTGSTSYSVSTSSAVSQVVQYVGTPFKVFINY